MRGHWGSHCRKCGQALSASFIESKRATRSSKIRQALAIRRSAGHHIGRPKNPKHNDIIRLRKQGLSLREISAQLRVGRGVVQHAIKDLKG